MRKPYEKARSRISTLLALAALVGSFPASGAEGAVRERQAAALITQFCAAVVAEHDSQAKDVAGRIPDLVIAPAVAIRDLLPIQQEALTRLLQVDEDGSVHYAGFDRLPGIHLNPHAVYHPGEGACLVVTSPDSPGLGAALAASLEAEGSPWTRAPADRSDAITWRRPTTLGETVFLLLSTRQGSSIALAAIEERPIATPEQIAATTRAALEPCIAGILDRRPPAVTAFASHFTEVNRTQQETVTLVRLRSHVAGPRSFLQFNFFERGMFCRFMTADARQSADEVRKAVMAVVTNLPDVREVQVPASDQRPAHTVWRIKRRGHRYGADITVDVAEQQIVELSVSEAGRR